MGAARPKQKAMTATEGLAAKTAVLVVLVFQSL